VSEDARYQAVLARDQAADGAFVFAVTTTGVYCRPSCPARRPLRANTRFFATFVAAEAAGFRPCRRCAPQSRAEAVGVAVVRTLCDELRASPERASLPALARRAGYSVSQVKRLFDQVLGLSPARFAEACREEALRRELRASDSVACAIYAAGYGAPSQVYGGGALGMPPGAFARGAPGEDIAWAVAPTPLGLLLLAATARGVCAVELGDDRPALLASLRRLFPRARLRPAPDSPQLAAWLQALTEHLAGRRAHPALPLDVRTTAFRQRVYRALQAIPRGQTRSYAEVARAIGQPAAARAVARACAENHLALLIPCHRVLRGDGDLAGYRWGLRRKRALLAAEGR
jgi:AraC family transcriptional regulator, regulatory protein of adaptative response / methylated-DNA-[protein]-cysteine methyltransferase